MLGTGSANPGTSTAVGYGAAMAQTNVEAFDGLRFEPERFVEAGDKVVVVLQMIATGRGSGLDASVHPTHVWTMRDEKVARVEVFPDRDQDEAFASAGL